MSMGHWIGVTFALGVVAGLTVTALVRSSAQHHGDEPSVAAGHRGSSAHKQNTTTTTLVSGKADASRHAEDPQAPSFERSAAAQQTDADVATQQAETEAATQQTEPSDVSQQAEAKLDAATQQSEPSATAQPSLQLAAALRAQLGGSLPALNPIHVDMGGLCDELFYSADPIGDLKQLVGRIRTAEARARDNQGPKPGPIAIYLARGLDEAGLFSPSIATIDISVVLPSRSKTFYLRVNDTSIPWPDMVRILAIEGALNRALFAWERLSRDKDTVSDAVQDLNDAEEHASLPPSWSEKDAEQAMALGAQETPCTIEECYRLNQALISSITAQVGASRLGRASMSDALGEWGARQAIAAGIESFRLPLRLSAQFRVNLMGGEAAIVADHVPWDAFPASVWSEELGRIVSASRQMRERAANTYAMRVALLLVSHAFRSSRRLCRVSVAIMLDSPARHACLLSGDVSREALDEFDLSRPFDAEQVCRALGFRMRFENGSLAEVEQGFSLDSERFCPRTRYETVDLSSRLLPRLESTLLGAKRVSDLAINENARRFAVAQAVARTLGPSTEHNVREILGITRNDPDETVRLAGKRTVAHLIDGSLSDSEPLAFSDEFVSGDELSRACQRAVKMLQNNRAADAVDVLTEALASVDALDTYRDTETVCWREFMSYVERALYNRLLAEDGREVRLVPDAYYSAQLLMSSALLACGRTQQALGFARRAQELDPLNTSGTLRVVRCLELLDRRSEAADELRHQLSVAFDPEGIGVSYYRLAFMEWRLGKTEVADACYQKAMTSRASCAGSAALELKTIRVVSGTQGVDPADVEAVLTRADIPLAPTERVLAVLVEAAQGATDAEVFPVARNFAALLGALSGDDVMHDVTNSLELEPDR